MKPETLLQKYWGHSGFRGSQEEIIRAVLHGRDVLALLPTGGGKSLCYQLPALAREGLCIVVSPLIALIQDQVASLKMRGIKAVALTGGLSLEEVVQALDNCQFGSYKFLYLSPERLQQDVVQDRISGLQVNLIAIDEAHCISQWGNDFRPAYLQCSILRTLHPDTPVIALTATATREVSGEIISNLGLRSCQIFKDSFARLNIAYRVIQTEDKNYTLLERCRTHPGSGIIYVRTRRNSEQLAGLLSGKGIPALFYHGGLSRDEKGKRLKAWKQDHARLMVATNAFGMGVDKPDVRLVVHYQAPDSLENYFQEAGRAGRDGLPSEACLLTNEADALQLKRQFLETLPDLTFLKKLYRKLTAYFQIPYGGGEQSTHYFDFNSFCDTYHLPTKMAYNGLEVLDRYSVISLSQQFRSSTQVRFLASKVQLWNFLEKNPQIANPVQILLRTYGGVFDFETRINPTLLAKKAGISEDALTGILLRLQKNDLISYQANEGDLEITFLVPREDDRTIHAFSRPLEQYQQQRISHVESVSAYIRNSQKCRSRQILEYFGEHPAADCGRCDVCLARKGGAGTDPEGLGETILLLLERKPLSSRAIIRALNQEEAAVVPVLQDLLEQGRIQIGIRNEYSLM